MAEQFDKGVTIPFTNIGTNLNKGTTSRVPLDTPNSIVTLTANTNTTNNREFRSALELADYNIKVNESASKLRDSEVYSASDDQGTHYDRKLTLKDLGSHMSDRMRDSIGKDETYNINLKGKMVIGTPGTTVIDTFENYVNKNGQATVGDLNGVGDPSSDMADFGKTSVASRYKGYIGRFSSATAAEFISKYCDIQSGIGMGEAKVLNPDFQFNEMDDVRTDFKRPKIGRLYAERIYDYNLPTVYFCPGKVEIKTNTLSLVSAFTRDDSSDITNYVKDVGTNAVKSSVAKMGNLLHTATSMGAKKILDTAQWYKWTPLTVKYTKYVNEMLIQLAVWMGLIDSSSSDLLAGWQEELNEFVEDQQGAEVEQAKIEKMTKTIKKTWGSLVDKNGKTYNVKIDKNTGNMIVNGYLGAATTVGNKGVLSVLTVLPQYTRNHWIQTGHFDMDLSSNSEFVDNESDKADNEDGLSPAEMFIPFGMCKGVSVSESFSNSMGEHPLSSEYNQMYEDNNTTNLTTGVNWLTAMSAVDKAGNILNGVDFMDSEGNANILGGVASLVGNVVSQYGAKIINQNAPNELGMVTSGAGRFVLPEVWTNSTFDRSYSITFKFRSPYGHRLSIYENTMVPLLFLISMTAPRAVGTSSYTNPFYIKAFSKGLFSCDLGMITSLSISRGEDKNDRTVDGFFRTVTASVSIKDMLPTMQMGLDIGKWGLTNSMNNGMISYMCNLAGVDFIERANLAKKYEFLTQRLKTEYEEFGSSIRSWMASSVGGASIIGLSAKSFGKSANPMNDRRYPGNYN